MSVCGQSKSRIMNTATNSEDTPFKAHAACCEISHMLSMFPDLTGIKIETTTHRSQENSHRPIS